MLVRRLQNGAVALTGALLPLVIACGIALAVVAAPSPLDGRTPNPRPAPWFFLGPIELLVYLEPWFAGTIVIWLILWVPALAIFVVGVLLKWPSQRPEPNSRGLPSLALLSVLMGLAFAAPWIYALVRYACLGRG